MMLKSNNSSFSTAKIQEEIYAAGGIEAVVKVMSIHICSASVCEWVQYSLYSVTLENGRAPV